MNSFTRIFCRIDKTQPPLNFSEIGSALTLSMKNSLILFSFNYGFRHKANISPLFTAENYQQIIVSFSCYRTMYCLYQFYHHLL